MREGKKFFFHSHASLNDSLTSWNSETNSQDKKAFATQQILL